MDVIALLEQLMRLLERVGINPIYAGGVVFLTTVFKSFDVKNKFKQGYVLFPLIAGFLVCLLYSPFTYENWISKSLVHAALGGYGYRVYAELIKNRPRRKNGSKNE